MRVSSFVTMTYERSHRQKVLDGADCLGCGAVRGFRCSGGRGVRASSHVERTERYLMESRTVLPEITKEDWDRYNTLMNYMYVLLTKEEVEELNKLAVRVEKIRGTSV